MAARVGDSADRSDENIASRTIVRDGHAVAPRGVLPAGLG
jgi:hypothetical protein